MASVFATFALAVLQIVLSVNAAPAPASSNAAPSATIDSGVIVGVQTSLANSPNLVNQYLGVPFAASPTRFSPPQTPTPWSSPLQATVRGPACIQQFSYPEASRNFTMEAFDTPPPPSESEDCLNLDIYVPAGAQQNSDNPRPVMFWIYGGGLAFGYNGVPAYDGTSFAANQDVIVVATNYRTNAFGFPGALSLPPTQRNLGFLDQRFALAWVQRNIAAFGGDPNKVTIFGESAGSFSVDALVTSYNRTTKPPFYAAIMESGELSVTPQAPNNGSAWEALIAALNCTQQNYTSDLDCARAAPASLIQSIEEHAALSFLESVDNFTYIYHGNQARAVGQIWPTPILTGTNSDEGSVLTLGNTNTTAYLLGLGLPESYVQLVNEIYPLGSYSEAGILIDNDAKQIAALFTDLSFQCPCAIVANTSVSVSIPTWRYFYNGTFPEIQPDPIMYIPDVGAYHSSEITLVFGTYDIYGPGSEQLARLSEYIQTSWATFARNPTGGPGWPSVANGGYVQILGGGDGYVYNGSGSTLYKASTEGALDGGRCALWEPIYQAVSGG